APASACCSACCSAGVEDALHARPPALATMNAPAQGDATSLMGRVRGLLGGLLEILETRLELLGTDAELQAQRLRGMAVLLLVGLFFLALALVFGSMLVIAAFWETHRLAAIGVVAGVHLFAGVGCLL